MAGIKTVGVIGAGQMGNGIAHICSLAGYNVVLNDISDDALTAGLATIEKNMTRQLARELITPDELKAGLARIVTTVSMDPLSEADLAIEAATENREVKEAIFRSLCQVIPEHAILATNTSSISVTRLASVTDRPERFIGLHFMNPVPLMKLVEVIRGLATDQETYETVMHVTAKLGKTVTNAEDYPAFIVNRILMPMINEAVYTLYEGVGTVEAIDSAMKLGANHPMGPLQLADFIGLDTCLWIGRKSGRGFYDYRGDGPVPTR